MEKIFKIFSSILACGILLTGCSNAKKEVTKKNEQYQTYYDWITSETSFASTSLNYTISAEMISIPDGTYRYYVIVDNPQTEMYNCVLMIVENDIAFADSDKMMPCIGIYEDEKYSLLPNQLDSTKGYVKGLTLSGDSDKDHINIKMIVEWTNENKSDTYQEYLSFGLSEEGIRGYYED